MQQFHPEYKEAQLKALIHPIYFQPVDMLKRELQYILLANNRTFGFHYDQYTITHYDGENYSLFPRAGHLPKRQDLDPSLHQRMDNYIREKEAIGKELHVVSAYFRKILNMSDNLADVADLMPKIMRVHLPQNILIHLGNSTHAKDLIKLFHQNNREAEGYIKDRLLVNLLLK